MSEPRLSVIVPIYNAAKHLDATLQSLLAVTESDIEIILVDDGSTDGSGELCDGINDTRVRVIHKKNGGVSSARNAGLDAVHGEYIGFLDADDLILPDMYSRLLARAEATGADIAQCAMVCVEEGGDERTVFAPKSELILDAPFSAKQLFRGLCYGCCSKIYKRSLVANIRFDTRFPIGEDLMFNLSCLKTARRIVLSPDADYRYIQRRDSATHTATSGERLLSFRNMTGAALAECESPAIRRYITDARLNNSTDVISKIIIRNSEEYSDTVGEIRREARKGTAFILFRSALPAGQKLKLLAIGFLYPVYSRLLRRKKRGS